MTISKACDQLSAAQCALSKMDTFLAMLKITSERLSENSGKVPYIEWINVTEILINQMEDISNPLQDVEVFLRDMSIASWREQP